MARLQVVVDGERYSLDPDDVLAWAGVDGPDIDPAPLAADYVRANPRPRPDAQGGVNAPARQRMALLRRLAAGPATRTELLTAMRAAAGYVGGDDWRNRLDELRGRGKRGGGHPALPIEVDEGTGTYRLTDPFPVLSPADRATIGRLKATLTDAGDEGGRVLLDALAPGIDAVRDGSEDQAEASAPGSSSNASQRSSPRTAESSRR